MADDPVRVEAPKRRFEVRYSEYGTHPDEWLVLGWHDTKEGAQRMENSWGKRPNVAMTWVVDTHVQHGGDFCSSSPDAAGGE